jgi:hypothetical protein
MSMLDQRSVHAEAPVDAQLTPIAMRASPPPAAPSVSTLTRDFLAWVASRPRSYAEAMEAWQTSCPRFTIWEDAISDGLIHLESENGMTISQTTVTLTPRGRAILDGN